jgi:hypothetical protein
MGSWCAMIGGVRLLLRFGGAMSLGIWSLVRFLFLFAASAAVLLTRIHMCLSDGNLVLTPLVSRGIEKNKTVLAHAGFLISYNSVRAVVVRVVRDQLLAFPDYAVVITGILVLFIFIFSCSLVNGWMTK